MSLRITCSAEPYDHASSDSCVGSSRQPTTLKRKRHDEDTELPPSKSRRSEFMAATQEYQIEMDSTNPLTHELAMACHHYTIGDYLKATHEFKKFLSSRDYSKEGSKIVITHSIFKLTRCYLALSDFEKARITLQELYSTSSEAAIGWGHSLFSELANLHSEIKAKLGVERNTSPGTEIATLERSLESVQLRITSMIRDGEHEAAVQLISKTLESVCIDMQKLGETTKDLLAELHLNLAEGYIYLNQPDMAQSALEQIWDPQKDLSIWWGHRLFNRMATLYHVVTKKDT
ncbi:hypothetical protein KEM48_013047 [Puccinia striiformis f. sp. tritici PST-130]|uniref:Uncharacterized protein n=1 Tax=Puccinia striiformis f. sp. tritici PST-78 TaxID=1165861 RepID=A0A0L0VV64_9BASI|nr:hypothetical protein KEM48_013047 [Puccinia striiformis f. sp. tritici PST-130]KNF03168.1 hypothetical protein PSTG_03755 [Puccinia striiformis f. sp. tritici PST-78]